METENDNKISGEFISLISKASKLKCLEDSSQQPPISEKIEEEEVYTLIGPRTTAKKTIIVDDDKPLVDTTEALPLKSKKTERRQKKRQEKLKRTTVKSDTKSFLELPPELLQDILGFLRPSDIFRLLRLNKSTAKFIQDNESSIVRDIIRQRYWVLSHSLQSPVLAKDVDASALACLMTPNWQEKTQINKRSYQQFIKMHDAFKVCSCMTCVLAWNHLNVVLDLAHFQKHLSEREPIPIIPRGTSPQWNTLLLSHTSSIVEKALSNPLYYALILQTHLNTIVGTLTRQVRVGKRTFHPNRLYHLSSSDIEKETDEFLERSGPPTYELPVYRDRYYTLEAYVPNRKWSREERRWLYYDLKQAHENEVAWVMSRAMFQPDRRDEDDSSRVESFVAGFKKMQT